MKQLERVLEITLAIVLLGMPSAWGQSNEDLRASLFGPADQARFAADEAQASVLAPDQYWEAMDHYRAAEDKLRRGKNIEQIRSDLTRAAERFRGAAKATELARVTFTTTIDARSDAREADAEQQAAELWREAEETFANGARRLEGGNVNRARQHAQRAESLYREAELLAIKNSLLAGTRVLLAEADQKRVERYAPKTLRRARELLAEAEKELNENRYDTDYPRSLARQAHYEARHALTLSEMVRGVKSRDGSIEDLVLEWEGAVQAIASSLDLVAGLDEGHEAATQQIVGHIEKLRNGAEALAQDVHMLQSQVNELQDQLGGETEAKQALARRIRAQEAVRLQLARLESMFSKDEARILREGEDVLIRLTGLTFPSGSAVIEPQYFGLLRRVQDAILVFPGSGLVVEGHTDSFGSDEVNMRLSRDRAQAVRQYLLANTGLGERTIDAVGYGESRPIGNNETTDGRARNRRIDVLIKPNYEAFSQRSD